MRRIMVLALVAALALPGGARGRVCDGQPRFSGVSGLRPGG